MSVTAPAPLVPRAAPRVVAAVLAGVCALAVHLIWFYFVTTPQGQQVDRLAWEGAEIGQGRLWSLAAPLLNVVSVALLVFGAATAMIIAIVRKRWVLALQVVALVGGANLTTQVLKEVYERPHILPGWTGPNSLPSGHTTAAASVAAALLLAVPRRWRPAVAVCGAVFTAMVGISTLVGQWHRPSDVVAAVLVTAIWALVACVLASRWSLDVAPVDGATSYVVGTLLLVFAAVAAGMAGITFWQLRRGGTLASMDQALIAYVGGIAATLAAASGAFGALLLVRQAAANPTAGAASRQEVAWPANS